MPLILPRAGELNRRALIRKQTDVANASMGVDQTFDTGITRWCKIEPVGGAQYWGTKQAGEHVTDRIWLRYGPNSKPADLTGEHVCDIDGTRYRIKRATDANNAREFTMLDVTNTGAAS